MNFWTLFFTFSIKMDTTQSLSDSAMISVRLITMDSYMNSPSQDSSNDFDPVYSMVWFIRYFHQSRIPNLQNFFMNIYYDFFFNWQTEKKHLFWTNKKFVFFFNCSNWEKILEKNKLVKLSDEFVTRYEW